MDEAVAMEFAADVAEAVTSVRELADSAQGLADTAKEAQGSVSGLTDEALTALRGALEADTAATQQLTEATLGLKDAQAEAAAAADKTAAANEGAAAKSGAAAETGLGKYKMALVGIGIGAAVAVDAAGKFQDSTTHLVTDAGESASNLALVQQGILSVSAATGTSANDITNAMYHIESGGMHGASGLGVLKVAAEGAKVGGADLDTVSKTLVGTLNAYGMTSTNAGKQTEMATELMNELITTVGSGDMRMQDLASALSNVTPLAAAAGISFDDVGGAIATMTAQGMSAQQATQDLSNTIRSLSNPNNVAINEMQQMGLNSQTVSQQLGQRGLSGTLYILTQAITQHMGPAGMVLQSSFAASQNAAADAKQEIAAMPASLQELAKQFMAGSVTGKEWKADLQALDPVQAHLMTQFATTAEKANSFNSLLAAGGPAAQTYTAALAKMMGGATGLNTALMLTGTHMQTFTDNETNVFNAGWTAANGVQNWATIQGTFNFKLDQAKESLKDTGIALGTALLPAVTSVLGPLAHLLAVIAGNRTESMALALVVGGILAGALGMKLAKGLKDAAEGVKLVGDGIGWLIGKMTGAAAATETQAAATETLNAAKEESVAATEGAAAAQGELDVAMDANPIGLIILAIVALIAVMVLLVTHWKTVVGWFHDGTHEIAVLFDGWRHDVAAAIDAVAGFFQALPGRILKFFESLPGDMLRVGQFIVQGLVQGVESMGSFLVSSIENLIPSPIRSVVSSVLGIFSPSTVFHGYGVNLVLGLINGVKSQQGLLRETMTGLAGGVTSGYAASAIGPATGGGTTVHVTAPMTVQAGSGYDTPQFQQYLQAAVQEATLRYAQVNPTNGYTPTWGR